MFFFYKSLTFFLYPFLVILIYLRKIFNKEESKRFKEKIFIPSNLLNSDKFLWFHGASIGEIKSVIPVIYYFLEKNSNIKILITSVTVSSASIVKNEFKNNNRVVHKYFPVDVPHLAKKFLNYWKPIAVIFIDSEIWPNFIYEIKNKKIPLILLNGRITYKTFKRWAIFKRFSNKIFNSFDICIASSNESKKNLESLGVKKIKYFGNLKFVPLKKGVNDFGLSLKNNLDKRKVWLASNTHGIEENFCAQAHKKIKESFSNPLVIIIPRHILRIKEICPEILKMNLKVQIINTGEKIEDSTDVALINSFGDLNKYYNYCKDVFVGKSLDKKNILTGGQNPIEAAKFGCKIYHGPYVYNFKEVYDFLKSNEMAEEILSSDELASKIINSFNKKLEINPDNIEKINIFGKNILDKTIDELNKIIKL